MLIRNSDIHTRNTRFNNMNMVCPKYTRETEGGRTFTVRTIKDWNALDVTLRKQKSIATFKRSLIKIYFICKYLIKIYFICKHSRFRVL